MKAINSLLFVLLPLLSLGQLSKDDPNDFLGQLNVGAPLPEKLLSTRSIVVYPEAIGEKELQSIQKSFQLSGVDAVAYFKIDLLLAGKDEAVALAAYFSKRDIINLIFFQKESNRYTVFITTFNNNESFIDKNQPAWSESDVSLAELLKKIYRSSGSLKRKNLLINDFPETDLTVNPINGRRSEFFAIDLKVDQLAVPKTGDEMIDKKLEEIFSTYPFKFKFTEPGTSERTLRSNGFLYVLCYVHAKGNIVREILGYDVNESDKEYVSVNYTGEVVQEKSIPSDARVYKFYFKHIDSGNVFLGTKWDADPQWEQALINHLLAFKKELRVN